MKRLLFLLTLTAGFTVSAQVSFSTQSIGTNYTNRGIVDMNGDNLDDIISISTNKIQMFIQQTDGTFEEREVTTTNANNTPSWSLAAADYDRNGLRWWKWCNFYAS